LSKAGLVSISGWNGYQQIWQPGHQLAETWNAKARGGRYETSLRYAPHQNY
jgi:hypothetical protein